VAAAQGQTGDSCGRDDAEGYGLAERMSSMVNIARRTPRSDPCRAAPRIDAHTLHHRHVDHQTVIDAAEPRPIMAAAPDSDRQFAVTTEIHGGNNVGGVGTARDEPRPFVDHRVIELACLIIAGVAVANDGSAKVCCEHCEVFIVHDVSSKPELTLDGNATLAARWRNT